MIKHHVHSQAWSSSLTQHKLQFKIHYRLPKVMTDFVKQQLEEIAQRLIMSLNSEYITSL